MCVWLEGGGGVMGVGGGGGTHLFVVLHDLTLLRSERNRLESIALYTWLVNFSYTFSFFLLFGC